jgi:hypothetical protein
MDEVKVELEEGWYEWHKMPENTTHIAHVYENGEVYIPEWPQVFVNDFREAQENGKVYRLVRDDRSTSD